MKNRFLIFLTKYLICFVLSVIMVIGVSLSTRYANVYESNQGVIRFDLREIYLVFGIPLYALMYGGLSFIKTRRVWIPQTILCIVAFLYWFRFDINALAWAGTFIWSVYPVIFSMIGTLITALIYFIIKSDKKQR